jgi:CRISPR-associated protein Cas1
MINIARLEPSAGFLHEFTGSQTKEPLACDLQEPFRWLGDVTTIEAFESGALDMKDFYFTGDDYSYKIEIEAKRRFLQLLKERFNSGVNYKDRVLKWDTVMEQKTMELARYVIGKSRLLDFSGPKPELERADNLQLRKRILNLSQPEARRIGIAKSTLHYLRRNARDNHSFRTSSKILQRLSTRQ